MAAMTSPSSLRPVPAAPGTAPSIIVVRDLRKRYGSLTAVDGVSFDVAEGEVP